MGGSSKLILGMILGGMMAIDMGGPFNKAAYVFGTAAIAAGNYDIMASVMIGGMVPPIAVALSNTFFKNRWTDERKKECSRKLYNGTFIHLRRCNSLRSRSSASGYPFMYRWFCSSRRHFQLSLAVSLWLLTAVSSYSQQCRVHGISTSLLLQSVQ